MNGGIVPLLLIAAALGFALSFTALRAAWIALGLFLAVALIASFIPLTGQVQDDLIFGLLVSTFGTAALVYLPRGLPASLAIIAAVNDGAWLGLFATASQHRSALAVAIPLGLILLPGRWVVARGYGLAIKVICSWLIAIAALAIFVSLVPTPGYKPDHMQ